ncbi:MAG TPA: trypsin-like peptidase domain-containing protein [Tepidisphaeraceae bacterium]|nr:trypsin-like peptidase domain-containing protein [Tepidisphaeraceae bacterium]
MRLKTILGLLVPMLMLIVSAAWAGKIVMKDGTVLEGTVIKTADGYWVKTSDGTTKTVAAEDVQSVDNGDSDSAASPDAGSVATDDASVAFRTAQDHASEAESALAAVSIWQKFVDKYPDSSDIPAARQELDRWKKLATDGAEKVNGQWVGGDQLRKIIAQADELTGQSVDMLEKDETLQAIDKLKQSVKIYPNSFMTNYALGYVSMQERDYDEAAQYFSTSTRLRPQSAEAENNLAVANFFRKRFEIAIDEFVSAVTIEDSKDLAQNLVTALALAPSDFRTLPRMKSTLEAASLLQNKYDITGPATDERFWILPPPVSHNHHGLIPGGRTGSLAWSGTGFFIDDAGLILTNRHVAKGAKNLLVVLPSGDSVSADVVAIDDQFDLALIRAHVKGKIPFLRLAPEDSPNEGADCVVMGFPMISELGADLKITRGVVSSSAQDQGNGADVLTDAKVNPGNSGGPIVDKFGNVMAIVCMKSITTGEYDSYGIGISAGHIREFLKRNHVEVQPGAEGSAVLSTEQAVTKVKPATICILATN